MSLKIGDKVVCIREPMQHIRHMYVGKIGSVYTISKISEFDELTFVEHPGLEANDPDRFKLHRPTRSLPSWW
jgi:hypothetical protein